MMTSPAIKRNRDCHICVVAARSGSKRLQNKNIKPFAGAPLLVHSLEQGQESDCFDAVLFSSDSEAYLDIASSCAGVVCVKRPAELAQAHSPKRDVLIHALTLAEAKLGSNVMYCTELQPTSPLRQSDDVRGAVNLLERSARLKNVVSVTEPKAPPEDICVTEYGEGLLTRLQITHSAARTLELNGAVYAWRTKYIAQHIHPITNATGYWLMPLERSLDIDTQFDFDLAEFAALRTAH